jgi:hypothetical protein
VPRGLLSAQPPDRGQSGYESLFLSEHGATLDPGRLAFYRLLHDVVS